MTTTDSSSSSTASCSCSLSASEKQKTAGREDSEKETSSSTSPTEDETSSAAGPRLPESRWKIHQWFLKRSMDAIFWRPSVEYFSAGPHRYASLCYYSVRRYPGVKGHVALTIDDAPCRFASRSRSRLDEVLRTLKDHDDSRATFMVVGGFLHPCHSAGMVELLRAGHELGNHGMEDRAYHTDTAESFGRAVDDCSGKILELHRSAGTAREGAGAVRYFRAPHAKYTVEMERVIRSRGLINVMCDTYSSCPIVEDGEYIGQLLSSRAQDGSIILLHMPERGFRDWCMVALDKLLKGLQRRNLRVVTVGMLQKLAGDR